MITVPFSLLAPYEERFDVRIFTKRDASPFTEEHAQATFDAEGCAGLHQIHGNKTVIVYGSQQREQQADAMISDRTELVLSTRWADCQNFVVYAPDRHVAGVIHSGWRGLVRGVIPSFFDEMHDVFHVTPEEVLVGAGPSLCKSCSEFSDPSTELEGIDAKFFDGRLVDLRAIADDQLEKAGVSHDRLERIDACPKCDNDTFWSYRGGDREHVINGSVNALCCMLK